MTHNILGMEMIIDGVSLEVYRLKINKYRPTIIFLHDSLGCITLWRDLPMELGWAANCNVLVYDRQGYGASGPFSGEVRKSDYMEREADVLKQIITHLGIRDVILFGHSDGGTIALIAGSKYPEGIIGIITEGAHIFVEEVTLNGIRTALDTYRTTDLKQKLEKYHGDKTDAVFHAWADTWLTPEYRHWNIEHFLPGIQCHMLVIQGANDEYGSELQVDSIVSQVSGPATKLMISGLGHTPHKQARDVVMAASITFIKRSLSSE